MYRHQVACPLAVRSAPIRCPRAGRLPPRAARPRGAVEPPVAASFPPVAGSLTAGGPLADRLLAPVIRLLPIGLPPVDHRLTAD